MTVADLLIIVPTRSRPANAEQVIEAWRETGAFDDGAALLFAYDADDPEADSYARAVSGLHLDVHDYVIDSWAPMVAKLNRVAAQFAGDFDALGFAGDDHLPRTEGWARRYIETLRELRTGIVYCDDGYQGERLPTQWAMTSDIVRELGAMVPAPVEHLFCDNAIRDLGERAGCLQYLPDALIEHMHPVAGKGAQDAQYERVNGPERWRRDRAAYREWRAYNLGRQARAVRALRAKASEVTS